MSIDRRMVLRGAVDYDYKPLPLRLVNNGHTIQFNADAGSACVLAGTRYELLQFHCIIRAMRSLTTPPCSEGLIWRVYREPVEASIEQIQKFAALFPVNARRIQKRNRRFIINAS